MKNKIFNRLAALMLCTAMLLAGCGGGESTAPSDVSSTPVESSASEAVETPVVEGELRDKYFLADKIEAGYERNSDTVGWLTIPNMEVDDAILQRNDPDKTHLENNSFYLKQDEDGNYSVFSCYWADPDSRMGTSKNLSKNTIIYGHSDYKDSGVGRKFTQLFKYNDIEFAKQNPYIYFSTEDEDMVWQVFAVFYTHIDFNYIMANPSDAQFEYILNTARARSEFNFDVDVTTKDKILTLSTCTGLYNPADRDNYRYVIMAKLLPTTDVSVDPVNVTVNEDVERT